MRLVLVAALPVWLAAAILIYKLHSEGLALITRDASMTARAMMVAVDRDLARAQTAALVLSASPDLVAGQLDDFRRLAGDIVRANVGVNVILTDESGQERLNLRVPDGEQLPVSGDGEFMRRVFATGRPEISDLYFGAVRHLPAIAVAQPVFIDDKVEYTLTVSLGPDRLGEILEQEKLPDYWVAFILDTQGAVVARSRDADRFIGKMGTPDLLDRIQKTSEGWTETNALDGSPVTAVFSRSAISGWSVVIGMPPSIMAIQLWRYLQLSVASTAALLVLGLAWANYQARRLAKPFQALEALALAHGRGDWLDPPYLALKEADDVSRALTMGARQLRVRTMERDRANEQRRDVVLRNQLIEEEAKARSDYFAYLSHELGSPLIAIRAFAEAIAKFARDKKILEYCARIDSTAGYLHGIVRQILDYAKCNAHELEINKEEIDVEAEIMEVIKLLEVKAAQQNLAIIHQICPHLAPVLADRMRFRQIFINLLSNALKFSPQKGKVTITAAIEDGDIVFRVIDAGFGISPEDLPRVLQPYVQGAHGPGVQRDGTGLGLPFAKALTELHGGKLELESIVGVGTTVTVRLPALIGGSGVKTNRHPASAVC